MSQLPTISGDFGEGAFGPTILLTVSDEESVAHFRDLLLWLSSQSPGTEIDLTEKAGFEIGAAVWALRLRLQKTRRRERRLWRDADGGFTWIGDPEEWETAALLVDALTRGPGFHYLTDETIDEAIVEVCRIE